MGRFTRLFVLLFTGTLLLSGSLKAQFNISGEFRPRFEYRDGYSKLRDQSQDPYADILGRNRLVFDYRNDPFQAKFSLQHAYVFGENNYSSDTITRNTVNIYEAWFRYAFAKNVAIRIGRMELVYDDSRILGNSNWSPRGGSHDVSLFQWELPSQGYRGDFGFAINNTAPASAYLGSYLLKNYKYMGFIYEQKKFNKEMFIISLTALLDAFQKPGTTVTTSTVHRDTLYVTNASNDTIGKTISTYTTSSTKTTSYPDHLYARITAGGTAGFNWKILKIFASGYYQGGKFSDGRDLSAFFAGGYASVRVVKPLTVLAGYEYLSGNDYSDVAGQAKKSTSFSALYGTNHGFYGYMDMFTTQAVSGNSAGLTDLYAKITARLGEKFTIEGTWRMFGLAKGYLPVAKKKPTDLPYVKADKSLGNEVDLMFVYRPSASFELNAAYCFFLPTSSMERLNGLASGTSMWAQYPYIMLTYKPTFFNSAK